ncbi:MAG: DUF2892 domain-containing protein [Flavobacteriaceae bacterium]|jgi:hypothetical protein|nr:DUF2892 domain-containing protein [Flavobacteriaceae bacterium]|tara:strand:- start:71 stop:292 length:222 start_codon:yes stop_codon:yes gene_type:complete
MKKNISKVRAHDAIVGTTYLLSVLGALYLNESLIYIAILVAALQIISPVTKFCPVYFVLNKLMPKTEPIQNGK